MMREVRDTMVTQADLTALEDKLTAANTANAATQAQILDEIGQLQTAITGIQGDIDEIQAANPALDLGPLTAKVDAASSAATGLTGTVGQLTTAVDTAQALDAQNPPAAP
jgi:hypothetical protein